MSVVLHSNKLESLSRKNDLCQVWLKLAQWFLRKKRKCENVFENDNNDDEQRTNFHRKSPLKPSPQMSYKIPEIGDVVIFNLCLPPRDF